MTDEGLTRRVFLQELRTRVECIVALPHFEVLGSIPTTINVCVERNIVAETHDRYIQPIEH